MAFSEALPKNSESRAIGVTMRLIKKKYPYIDWIISFADGTQCGDGTIYRASGFKLVGISKNTALRKNPTNGEAMHVIQAHHLKMSSEFRKWTPLPGFQFKYIYFLNKKVEKNLNCEILPFSTIDELGVGMYKGKRRVLSKDSVAIGDQPIEGGANPTNTLQ